MADIGKAAGSNASYRKDGVYVSEETARSRAVIEQDGVGEWQGLIRLRTQGRHAGELLALLGERFRKQTERWCVCPVAGRAVPSAIPNLLHSPVPPPPLTFVREPASRTEYCVSYARGDATPEGKDREAIVDRFYAEAERRRIKILRDKRVLGLGDRISRFMQRIGRADRVFVVLSELSRNWRPTDSTTCLPPNPRGLPESYRMRP